MHKTCELKKLKVVFIDDERLVRQLLINCVDWDNLGYEVAGDSPGGRHALDMVASVRPDLVFVDICMPIMDGIELSGKIMKALPDTHIIVVTGHQEFNYARESIKVGVTDFLLKPINPKEIAVAALKAKEAILQAESERKEVEELKQRMENNYPHLKERILDQLIHGSLAGGEMDASLSYFDIHFEESFFQVALMSIDFKPSKIQADARKKAALMCEAKDICGDVLDRYGQIYYYGADHDIVVLSNNSSADLYEALECIKGELTGRIPCMASAGLSDAFTSIEDIQEAYNQALEALSYKLVCGKGHTVRYGEIMSGERAGMRDDKQIDLLGSSMKSGLIQNAEDAAVKALEALSAEEISRPEQLHAAGAKVLSECLAVTMECNIAASEIFGNEGNPYEKIFAIETLPRMKKYLKHCAGKIARKVLETNKSKVHSKIQDIKQHIEDNISDSSLSLSTVANAFYLNASYLSRLFKQETGYTFGDYIKKIRMEKILELLHKEDLKVYQLCERVGMEDPHYLSILFKKYTGITISEYKQRLKKHGA
jgi:two-component system response regulator YesN